METKELRKSLRHVLEGLQKEQTNLETILTEENKEIFRQYPSVDGAWKHPNSHYFDRINEYITNARKLIEKVIQALPRERKKKGEKRAEKLPPAKRGRKSKDGTGKGSEAPRSSRNGDKPSKGELPPTTKPKKPRGRPKTKKQ